MANFFDSTSDEDDDGDDDEEEDGDAVEDGEEKKEKGGGGGENKSVEEDAEYQQNRAMKSGRRGDDPFADYGPGGDERRRSQTSSSSSSSSWSSKNSSFGGKRVNSDRTELDDLLDVGMRFEGARTLLKALRTAGLSIFDTDLGRVTVGQLVVVSIDAPSLQLWSAQAYEVKRVYYQRRDDDLGSRRVDVKNFGAGAPTGSCGSTTTTSATEVNAELEGEEEEGGTLKNKEKKKKKDVATEWELWVELFSPEYHACPVRVRPSQVGLRTVGAEVGEALVIAVPIACFWAAVGASFVITATTQ